MHEDKVVRFAWAEDEREANELLIVLVEYMLDFYDAELHRFALENDVPIEDEVFQSRDDYAMYISDLFIGLRERAQLRLSEDRKKLRNFIITAFVVLVDSESSNILQLAQLDVALIAKKRNNAVKIYKTWHAHPDCCDLCGQLDGTTKLIDEPFLVNGQIVEMANGEEVIYDYIDRLVAIAHPNDRCWIEFSIRY